MSLIWLRQLFSESAQRVSYWAMTQVRVTVLTAVCFVILLASRGLSAANRPRYFKEDGLTGADYFVLATDGTYSLTGLEHMGVLVIEVGRWKQSGAHITFTPTKPSKR